MGRHQRRGRAAKRGQAVLLRLIRRRGGGAGAGSDPAPVSAPPSRESRRRARMQRAVAALALGAALGGVAVAFLLIRLPSAPPATPSVGSHPARRAPPTEARPHPGTSRAPAFTARAAPPSGHTERSSAAASAPPRPLHLLRPVPGETLLAYGWSLSPTFGDWRFHSGVDLAAPVGTPVKAAAAGTVAAVTHNAAWGWQVDEALPGAADVRYRALGSVAVSKGASVAAGEVIGRVGASPRLEAGLPPHVSVQVSRLGRPVDPSGLWR